MGLSKCHSKSTQRYPMSKQSGKERRGPRLAIHGVAPGATAVHMLPARVNAHHLTQATRVKQNVLDDAPGTGGCCLPRHGMPCDSIDKGSNAALDDVAGRTALAASLDASEHNKQGFKPRWMSGPGGYCSPRHKNAILHMTFKDKPTFENNLVWFIPDFCPD